ncbi:MAG: alpha-glucan family phosphorylase [Actinomycetota bacterium]|nr:alpha-glucan family phosphorylase [Actinomycetota bacterium]
MRAIRSFSVRAAIPESLRPLETIAMNLRWTWNGKARDLFRRLDREAWNRSGHEPLTMLGLVSQARFAEAAADPAFMQLLGSVAGDLERYLNEPRWYQSRGDSTLGTVAYFSPEFGVSEALPIYAGGLGVLAGDHLKAASDLGVPLVGVGLLYREGYFRQQLDADGWQQERYSLLDPHAMPLTLLSAPDGGALKIEVVLAGERCVAQLWSAQVGRTPLLLMDCDVEDNEPEQRTTADRLYAGGSEHRMRQEILLGIGGIRALEAAGYKPDVFHSNEGHAGFLGLERIRRLVVDEGLTFAEGLEAVRSTTIFTTHTPVPAGIDIYAVDLFERHFGAFARECNISVEELLALGQVRPGDEAEDEGFNMAVMGFRLAGRANGVSKLHGEVSRSIFSSIWPQVPPEEVPIGSITNGVHVSTWLGTEMSELFDDRLPPGWAEAGDGGWEAITEVPDDELWRERERARSRLVYGIRQRLRVQGSARGASDAELEWTHSAFDPGVLTIGFARRFAQYKRGTLLLSDPERLKRLLLSDSRPIQLVFSGKAHPADDGGKDMIRRLVHFSNDPEIRHRLVFLEDYDLQVARRLCQGVDVWLNHPRRPLEASGTSGMKAALNGVINCSILDGWWDECFDPGNGWAIGAGGSSAELDHQDRIDAAALYDVLEREVIPSFYERADGPPARWVKRMKASVATLGPFVTADRMLRDYIEQLYEPAARQGRAMAAESYERARDLARWKAAVRETWDEIGVAQVQGDTLAGNVGEERTIAATVRLGTLSADDVSVQLGHGRVGAGGDLVGMRLIDMQPEHSENGTCTYRGSFVTTGVGLYGFTVRVLPAHPDLINRFDLGLVEWGPG